MTIAELIRNTVNAIMIYATSVDIAREREELSQWFDREWAKIRSGRHAELVKALLTDRGDELAKAADILAKAAPDELLLARRRVVELKAELGKYTDASSSHLAGLKQIADVLGTYNERSAALNRLKKRSDFRFAVQPAPAPRHSGHH